MNELNDSGKGFMWGCTLYSRLVRTNSKYIIFRRPSLHRGHIILTTHLTHHTDSDNMEARLQIQIGCARTRYRTATHTLH